MQHGGRLHQGQHQLHGYGDGTSIDVIHDTFDDLRCDAFQVHSSLAALPEVATEHGSEVRAARNQDVPVAWDLLVFGAQDHISEDLLLSQYVQLKQEVSRELLVLEWKDLC